MRSHVQHKAPGHLQILEPLDNMQRPLRGVCPFRRTWKTLSDSGKTRRFSLCVESHLRPEIALTLVLGQCISQSEPRHSFSFGTGLERNQLRPAHRPTVAKYAD